jgi:hypothetical protein
LLLRSSLRFKQKECSEIKTEFDKISNEMITFCDNYTGKQAEKENFRVYCRYLLKWHWEMNQYHFGRKILRHHWNYNKTKEAKKVICETRNLLKNNVTHN